MENIPSSLLYIQSLIDLISEPAFVYLRTEDRLFKANAAFHELSGYNTNDLLMLRLSSLLPEDPDTNPTTGKARPALFHRADGELFFVLLKIVSLSPTNQIVLLVLTPQVEENPIRQDLLNQEYRYDNLKLLSKIAEQKTVQAIYQIATEIIDQVIEPQQLLAYEAEGDNFVSITSPIPHAVFPDELKSTDITPTTTTTFWREGKATQNNLEKHACDEGMSYLITAAMPSKDGVQGLFVLGGHGNPPDLEDLRYLNLLGAQCGAAISNLSLLDNARSTLRKVRHIAAIQQRITDNLEEGIIILTPDLRITEMNPAAENMLGYASLEVFQQDVEMVLIGSETLPNLYKSAQQGIPISSDIRLNHRNGIDFPAQSLCLPVMENETVKSIVLILRDISKTEKIRQHTKQLEQRAFLGEFAAIFAHEVKNPINSIATGLQLLGMQLQVNSPQAEWVERLQNDCQRLKHLVNSTLSFSKPVEYQPQPLDLRNIIPLILEKWSPRMAHLKINYDFNAPEELILVKADPRPIEQVFTNLITNAIQAMEEKGGSLNVKINLADPQTIPPQCEIIVADSGPGIPDDVIDHIFEPFLTTKGSGTGLGLAITKRIVTAHEGSMFVESFPGGSMFHVLLPLWKEE